MTAITTTPTVVYTNNATTVEVVNVRTDGPSCRWSAGPDPYQHSFRCGGTPSTVALAPGETLKTWTNAGTSDARVAKVVPF